MSWSEYWFCLFSVISKLFFFQTHSKLLGSYVNMATTESYWTARVVKCQIEELVTRNFYEI
jgi:hypothetical protein